MIRKFLLCLLLFIAATTSAGKCDLDELNACSDDSDSTSLLQSGVDFKKLVTDHRTPEWVRYWVDDGCQSEIGVKGDRHSENMVHDDVVGAFRHVSDAVAAARCCDDAVPTTCSSPIACPQQSTLAEASKVCTDMGQRLCTKSELLSDICCGTGGNCDSYAVWTSTPDYTKYGVSACKGRNELYKGNAMGLADCAAKCSQDATCVSFEFFPHGHPTQGNNFCQLSSTCTAEFKVPAKLGADLYIKAEGFTSGDLS